MVKKNDKNENELYFVFFKKDLAEQSNNNLVKDALLLPSDEILSFFNKSRRPKTALQLATLFHDCIINNKGMNWQQKIFNLYNGKNNENININQDQKNNNINVNNNLNNNIFEENKEIKNENNNNINSNIINQENNEYSNESGTSNDKEEEIKKDNNNPNDNTNNIISQNLKNSQEDNNTEIKTNTVSLFGLGCYQIQSDERDDHFCGGCFW